VSESQLPIPGFQPDLVKPGPIGLRYTILDHRGARRPLATATWTERAAHAPNASRFLPKLSMSVSTIGLLVLVVTATFAMQDAGSRLATTISPGSSVAKTAIQLLGLFGPLLIIILLILLGLFFSASRIWMPAVARHWLSIGQCASCRYDIAEIEPEVDACVVCPECGAAWKISRASQTKPAGPERRAES
jgi:predicted RNA-binding Zn-ribbon protein involved in translation (DUF1610 family)